MLRKTVGLLLFWLQDDYLDCFGDLRLLGKAGMDVASGKCSWPTVVTLEKASAKQKAILEVSI